MTHDSATHGIGTNYNLDDALEDAAAGNECDDPNCIVCCDDETFARLTNFATHNMMTLEADDE